MTILKRRDLAKSKTKSKRRKKGERREVKGRPRLYNKEMADKICELLANGKSLTSICREEKFPCYGTVMRWLWEDRPYREDFLKCYDEARQQQAEFMADDTIDIADNGINDYVTKIDEKTGREYEVLNIDHIKRSALRVHARQWAAAHLRPKKYGNQVSVTGADGKPLITNTPTIINHYFVESPPDAIRKGTEVNDKP
jgi:hypothetical protein